MLPIRGLRSALGPWRWQGELISTRITIPGTGVALGDTGTHTLLCWLSLGAKLWLGIQTSLSQDDGKESANSPAICSSVSWSAWKGRRRVSPGPAAQQPGWVPPPYQPSAKVATWCSTGQETGPSEGLRQSWAENEAWSCRSWGQVGWKPRPMAGTMPAPVPSQLQQYGAEWVLFLLLGAPEAA